MAGTLSVQKIQGLATSATPTTVEIASGHKISGNITHGSGSVFPAGMVIQTVDGVDATQTTTTSTTFTASNLTVTITPKFASSKILVGYSMTTYNTSNLVHNKLISDMLVIVSVTAIAVPKLMIPCELYAVFSRETGPDMSVTELASIVPEVYPSRVFKSVTDTEVSVRIIFSLSKPVIPLDP